MSRELSEPVVYCKNNCSTCKKAFKFLDEHGIKYKKEEITKNRPSEEEFLNILENSECPAKSFFNTRGTKFKEMDLKSKLDSLSDEEKAKLLAEDGMLIKRPLLLYRHFAIPGFKPEEWKKVLRIDEES